MLRTNFVSPANYVTHFDISTSSLMYQLKNNTFNVVGGLKKHVHRVLQGGYAGAIRKHGNFFNILKEYFIIAT